MSETPVLTTGRLILRGWREADRAPLAELNADPEVMEHFPAPLSRAESDAMIDRARTLWVENGFCWFAVQLRGGPFIGFAGLHRQTFEAPFLPAVEIGWRLARAHWGHGYATEAAAAAVGWGFGTLGLADIISFTAVGNHRSRAVMERLGMYRDPAEDFDHPCLPVGHRLRWHVLYRLRRDNWGGQTNRR